MNSRESLVSEISFLGSGAVCPHCHIAVGLSEGDKIESGGVVFHGACFDRLPVPPEVMAGFDAVLDDLFDQLIDSQDKKQLTFMLATFRRDASKHRCPIGVTRRNMTAIVRKLIDMQDVPRARDDRYLVQLLSSAIGALKNIAAHDIPNRRLVARPRLWVGLAVGSTGMRYDRRDSGRKRSVA